mgnify:FL=1
MKNLLIGITLLILFSCSSNPKNTNGTDLEESLIQKPQINYKLNSLPKDINVIYFANPGNENELNEEVKGLLTNYYTFSQKYSYFPKIKFFRLNQLNNCSFILNRSTFNIVFLLNDTLDKKFYETCLNRIGNQNSLFVVDSFNKNLFNNFRNFSVDRNQDKYRLLKFMNSSSNSVIVIDNEVTKDKYEIGKYWETNFKKEVTEYRTFNKSESSESLFSNLLLSEQSIKRKRKLSRIISQDIEQNPRTRGDIDALFLSVNTQEARSLKPALDYNYIEGMKVFLANDWKEDVLFSKTDKDLENVISIDIPFMLQTQLPEELDNLKNKTRNFAIGYDSFEIVLLLKGSRNLNKITYKGLTGNITFGEKDIKRKSTIFKIQNGSYKYLNDI